MQDAESLYLGLEYCPNGELYEQLQERGSLPIADVVQYAAEIVDILAYLRYTEISVHHLAVVSCMQCARNSRI